MKKIIIFGAGNLGKRALKKYGEENVLFIIDNDKNVQGKRINGVEIKSPNCLRTITSEYIVVVASRQKKSMIEQLSVMGISKYEVYSDEAYFDIPEVVYNPYGGQYIGGESKEVSITKIRDINNIVERMMEGKLPLFNHIEIETINRCNGVCSFCPVNRNSDTRELKRMEEELFYSIINQLEKLKYTGKIALFSNNEPFLDDRIIEFHKYMREHLPYARTHLCTNGTLLTVERLINIMPYLDELIIDNYNDKLELINPCKDIAAYCEQHEEMKRKITIVLRKANEVLTSRGGDSPNVAHNEKYPEASCILPYKQIIVRPDGKVSLCCNDALGKCTLGDLNNESLVDVWFGAAFSKVREQLRNGRQGFERCKYCDTLFVC